jgi:hypothetical protein
VWQRKRENIGGRKFRKKKRVTFSVMYLFFLPKSYFQTLVHWCEDKREGLEKRKNTLLLLLCSLVVSFCVSVRSMCAQGGKRWRGGCACILVEKEEKQNQAYV